MYPDNKNLAFRAAELGNDCTIIPHQLNAYEDIAQTAIPFEQVELGDNWIQNIANMVSPFVVYPAITNAF